MPVDGLDIVARGVLAHLFKFNARAFEHRPVLSCHQGVDGFAGLYMNLLDLFYNMGRNHFMITCNSFLWYFYGIEQIRHHLLG